MFHYGSTVTITSIHYTLPSVFFQGLYISNRPWEQKNLNFYSNLHSAPRISISGVPVGKPAASIAFPHLRSPAFSCVFFPGNAYPVSHQQHGRRPSRISSSNEMHILCTVTCGSHALHTALQPYRKSGINPCHRGYCTDLPPGYRNAASAPPSYRLCDPC